MSGYPQRTKGEGWTLHKSDGDFVSLEAALKAHPDVVRLLASAFELHLLPNRAELRLRGRRGYARSRAKNEAARASLAAAILSSLTVYVCLARLDPGGQWNGLATFLVSPLAIAFSLATVLACFGFREGRRRPRKRHA